MPKRQPVAQITDECFLCKRSVVSIGTVSRVYRPKQLNTRFVIFVVLSCFDISISFLFAVSFISSSTMLFTSLLVRGRLVAFRCLSLFFFCLSSCPFYRMAFLPLSRCQFAECVQRHTLIQSYDTMCHFWLLKNRRKKYKKEKSKNCFLSLVALSASRLLVLFFIIIIFVLMSVSILWI